MNPKNELIYLAGPYTHKETAVMVERFEKLTSAAGKLMVDGKIVYSPITHCHPVQEIHDLPSDWEYWQTFCTTMLSRCDLMVVVMLDGWEESVGVTAEIKIAVELGMDIQYIEE